MTDRMHGAEAAVRDDLARDVAQQWVIYKRAAAALGELEPASYPARENAWKTFEAAADRLATAYGMSQPES